MRVMLAMACHQHRPWRSCFSTRGSAAVDADFLKKVRPGLQTLGRALGNPGCSPAIPNEFLARLCKTRAIWIDTSSSTDRHTQSRTSAGLQGEDDAAHMS